MNPPLICPYCGSKALLRDSAMIYRGYSYGWVWLCPKWPGCDSYVGCHKGTNKPLGRMANKELRDAKSEAHKAFDVIWRRVASGSGNEKFARVRAYAWLAEQLQILRKECHIGMMDVDTCRRVVDICNQNSGGNQ